MASSRRHSAGRIEVSAVDALRAPRDWIEQAAVTVPQRFFDHRRVSTMAWLRRRRPIAKVIGGTVVVTRRADVLAVLEDPVTFPPPYVDGLAGRFVLGLSGDDFVRHRAALDRVLRQDDLPQLERNAREVATSQVRRASPTEMAVGAELILPVLAGTVTEYLGLRGPDQTTMLRWARAIFQDIFLNGSGLSTVHRRGAEAVEQLKVQVRAEISARGPGVRDDVMGRLPALREAPAETRLADDEIVDTLVGLAIGWLWHSAKAALITVDSLLEQPEVLLLAKSAARGGRREELRRIVWEVLRFRPVQVGLPRACARDTTLGRGTPWETDIAAGAAVLAGTHSAMWDETVVPDPDVFDPSRADEQYVIFGHGQHRCLGEPIIGRQLPAMLMPLLAREGLERAPGHRGRLSWVGPSPDDLWVRFSD